MLLKNKTAVITGCNKGIGKKILEIFSINGADIYACVRKNNKEFSSYIENISSKNKNTIVPIELDFEDLNQVKNKSREILEKSEKIDVIVNNVGIVENSIFQMTTIQNIKKIFDVNFFSQMAFTQILLKSMTKQKNGSIIYISSSSAIDGNIGRNAYSSSKAATISQAKTLAREIGKMKIRVNVIAPGLTETDMMKNNTPKKIQDEVINQTSLNRIGTTEDIANVALFFASDLSKYVTGQTLRVDGGI